MSASCLKKVRDPVVFLHLEWSRSLEPQLIIVLATHLPQTLYGFSMYLIPLNPMYQKAHPQLFLSHVSLSQLNYDDFGCIRPLWGHALKLSRSSFEQLRASTEWYLIILEY